MTMRSQPAAAAVKSRVLVVDDHPIVRQGLALMINREPDLVVCGEAEEAQAALAVCDELRPDVVLMHLGTNDMWGGFIPLATKLAAFTKLVGQMRANNPSVKIVVAQIIPMSTSFATGCAKPAFISAYASGEARLPATP